MSFTNDLLLRTLQVLKGSYGREIESKSFLMLGKQEMHLSEDFLDILKQSGLIDDKSKFGRNELEDSVLFFKAFGFKEVHALDVSDYEGADIIFNLNEDVPNEYVERFDVVYDGGVIEHVFQVNTAFANICKMTKVGGYIFNHNPVYNYLYNTFWNISPQMFLEFYAANDYLIIDSCLLTFLTKDIENRPWQDRPVTWSPDIRLMNLIHPLYTGQYIRSLHNLCENPIPHTFIVAKKTNSKDLIYPIVSGYAKRHREFEKTKDTQN